MNSILKTRNVIGYILVVCITFFIFQKLYEEANFAEPLAYEGDSIVGYSMIKSIQNTGTWMCDELLGAGSYNIYEHNTGNMLDYILIKVLCICSDNIFKISNIYYAICILLASATAYYVIRKLSVYCWIAGAIAIIYAYSPYSQLRCIYGGHLIWLGCYYIIPICFLVCMVIRKNCKISRFTDYVLIALIGLSNIYYVFFFGIFFTICCLRQIAEERNKESVLVSLKRFLILVCSVAINFLPSICFYIKNASNDGGGGPFNRLPEMAEIYGLKMTTLFLPRLNHRWPLLSKIHDIYIERVLTNGETEITSLGIIGSLGLILVFVFFWIRLEKKNAIMEDIIMLTVSALLIGIIGGVGPIIAYMIPMIRCYARISIFISFFVCIFISLNLNMIYKKIKWKKVFYVFIGILFIIGICDQTVKYQSEEQEKIISLKNSQELFLKTFLDDKYGQKIYQYPGEAFPTTYSFMYWYVLDKLDTKWSSGAPLGREIAYWENRMEKIETEDFLEQLVLNQYDGILIDYDNSIVKYGSEKTERFLVELSSKLNMLPMYNESRTFYYFSIKDMYESDKNISKIIYPIYKIGDASEFTDEAGRLYRWMREDSIIFLQNDDHIEKSIWWDATFMPSPNMIGHALEIVIDGTAIGTVKFEDDSEKKIHLPISVGENGTTIELLANIDGSDLSHGSKLRLYSIKEDTYFEQELKNEDSE